MDTDKGATVAGVVLAGLVAANVDWAKAVAGDKGEISKAIGAGVVAVLGWLTNRVQASKPPKS